MINEQKIKNSMDVKKKYRSRYFIKIKREQMGKNTWEIFKSLRTQINKKDFIKRQNLNISMVQARHPEILLAGCINQFQFS